MSKPVKVTAKVAEKTFWEKLISYGPLLPCLAVAVLVIAGLAGYHAPTAAMNAGNSLAVSDAASAGEGAATGGTSATTTAGTSAVITRTSAAGGTSTRSAAASNTAASGAKKSLATVQEAAAYKDGTYTGTATGFRGPVSVQVTVSGGKISAIVVTSKQDDEPYFSNAKAVINKIINGQTTNVDVVSGATYSSNGIIGAVRNALSKAAVSSSAKAALSNTSNSGSASSSGSSGSSSSNNAASAGSTTTRKQIATGTAGQFPYPDGTYEGVGEGRNDIIRLNVTLKDGSITAIQIVEHYEDEVPYFNDAKTLLDDVLAGQTLNVDTVSGATLSSNGLLEALNDALNKAKAAGNGTSENTNSGSSATNNAGTTGADNSASASSTTGTSGTNSGSNTSSGTTSTTKVDATSSAQPAAGSSTGTGTGSNTSSTTKSTVYKDGTYTGSATCYPDEDEDFDSYTLYVSVKIENDQIVSITGISGNGDSSNDSYINRAANGKSSSKGVVDQITSSNSTSGVDSVSGATCSSDAIVSAVDNALAQAAAANR